MNNPEKTARTLAVTLIIILFVLIVVGAFSLGSYFAKKKNQEPASTPYWQNDVAASETSGSGDTTAPGWQNDVASTKPEETDPATAPAQNKDIPRNLGIEMTAGSLTFVTGDSFSVKYDSTVVDVRFTGDTMEIQNAQRHPSASERRRMDVTVTVPGNYAFGSVNVSFGAGKLIVHALNAESLDLELGAGSATFDNLLITGSAEIKEGAGELSIRSGSEIHNLNLQCGAGATRVVAKLVGTSKIDAAVGAVDLDFEGSESDYTVSFQMGIGAVYYNNQKISRSDTFGSGPNRVDISGGFGVMRVNAG